MVKPPKYVEQFKRISPERRNLLNLKGGRIIIEILEAEELKTSSGLIIQTPSNVHKNFKLEEPTIGAVLMVGSGYDSEDGGEKEPVDLEVGNIVIVSDYGIKYYKRFPSLNDFSNTPVGLTTEAEVQVIFEDYEKFMEFCNVKK